MLSTNFQVIGLSVQEKKGKIDFQDSRQSGHLGFLIETILAMFDLHLCFLLSIKLIGPWVQEKKRKKDFQMAARRPSWISDLNDFNYF